MSTDASAWLLERFDKGAAPCTNWTRPLFQVLLDGGGSSDDDPRPSLAAARWPTPILSDDLDEWDAWRRRGA